MTSSDPDEVLELGVEWHGRWLVETQGSIHIWDLDRLTVTRIPGPDSQAGAFDYDSETIRITRVTHWPRVGSNSLIWFDDPANPRLEHYRLSSTIRRIVRASDGHGPIGLLEALLGPCWTAHQVCYHLDLLDLEQLEELRSEGRILGLLASDSHRVYPANQFATFGNVVGVKPALLRLFRSLRRQDSWQVALLVQTPASELHGETPLAWADQGGDEYAIDDLIRRVVHEWG